MTDHSFLSKITLQVKLLARKPEKVTKVLSQLFDAATLETYQEQITVVAGGVMTGFVGDG